MQKKRLIELDILRGLAIISVILIHITSTALSNAQSNFEINIALLINQLNRAAVPTFLILSGLGLTLGKKYIQNTIQLIKGQLSKIINFYLIWSTIYYFVASESISLGGFLKSLLLGSSYYHLYYVPLIVVFYILYPYIYKYLRSTKSLLAILALTLISQLSDIFLVISFLNNPLNIFNWLFFFVFGVWLAANFSDKVKKIKANINLILIGYVAIMSLVYVESLLTLDALGESLATTSMRPSVLILSIFVVLTIIGLKWGNQIFNNFIVKIANASYGVYLSHAFILSGFEKIWVILGYSLGSFNFIVVAFLVVTSISYFISIGMDILEKSIKGKRSRSLSVE